MKTITYKGFQASVEFEDGALFVKVLHIDDLLVAQVDAASAAPEALKELVDAYLEDCRELGKEPHKSFSGTFNVRVGPDLHRKAAMAAAAEGKTLNAWIEETIRQRAAAEGRPSTGQVSDDRGHRPAA